MVGTWAEERLRLANETIVSPRDHILPSHEEAQAKVDPYQDLACQFLKLRRDLEETIQENIALCLQSGLGALKGGTTNLVGELDQAPIAYEPS